MKGLYAITAFNSVLLLFLIKQTTKIMAKQKRMDEALARLDAATNEIAADLKALKDEIGDTISDESLATLESNISKLEAMGAENPAPPDEPTEPEEPTETPE